MREHSSFRTRFVMLSALIATVLCRSCGSSELSNELTDRARNDVAGTQTLVGQGDLPKSTLALAMARLAWV